MKRAKRTKTKYRGKWVKGETADEFYRASGLEGTEYDVAGSVWTPEELVKRIKRRAGAAMAEGKSIES